MERQLLDMMLPLPGWLRFRNIQTGVTIDINPSDSVHQILLKIYRKSPNWEQIA